MARGRDPGRAAAGRAGAEAGRAPRRASVRERDRSPRRPAGGAAALALALLLWAGGAPAQETGLLQGEVIVRLPSGDRISSLDALQALAAGHDLVVLGEIHDNPRHQALQAEMVRRLAPVGLAFEMLKAADAPALAAARAAGDDLRPGAEAGGYAAYLPVIAAAPPGAPIAGAGLSRARLRQAIAEGAAAAIGPALFEAGGAPDSDAGAVYGLSDPPDADRQAEVEAEMAAAHCGALPEAMLPGMAEAQRLRDAAFAAALLRARAEGRAAAAAAATRDAAGDAAGTGPAVLVTGDGHARRDRGVPAYLGRAEPGLATLSVAMVEWPADVSSVSADLGSGWRAALAPWASPGGPAEAAPFDVVVVTARAGRDDPCAGFAKPAQ
ncbi:MAG: ChaN family lipoprotein [Pseudomonadota bacterium]|nr:ChaN family lipoprotein [Pseudomonadota bacterium]